jgi:acyl-coenzyme A synthetase/AMP-(fatty) acid ligase
MIKTAGANVSPREVEAAILELTGLVAHVVGIDDAARGQLVAAAVRLPAARRAPDVDDIAKGVACPAVGVQGAAADRLPG